MGKMEKIVQNYIWQDRKRTFCGLPWTFTTYKLTSEKLLINSGMFTVTQEEVRLYRIMDVTLKRTFMQRIFKIGTIHCCSGDKSTPEFDIKNIKNPEQVKELISKKVEEERDRKKISGREFMGHYDYDDDYDGHNN